MTVSTNAIAGKSDQSTESLVRSMVKTVSSAALALTLTVGVSAPQIHTRSFSSSTEESQDDLNPSSRQRSSETYGFDSTLTNPMVQIRSGSASREPMEQVVRRALIHSNIVQPDLTYVNLKPISLTDRERVVLDGLVEVIRIEAYWSAVRFESVQVARFDDPDEGSHAFVLTLKVPLPPRAAFMFWDDLGSRISRWAETLPHVYQDILDERFVVDVEWLENDDV